MNETKTDDRNSIKNWALDDRPREKLTQKGKHALSDAELIAIILGSGNTKESAVDLARKLLKQHNNDLNLLAKSGVKDLCQFSGIGIAKAVSVIAAMELGRRNKASKIKNPRINSSKNAFEVITDVLSDLPHEEIWVIAMSRHNRVVEKYQVSKGGVSGTVADIKLIFKPAIQLLSSAIILCHNHPSGNLQPSKADIMLTEKVKAAGEVLDITVLDHIIVCDDSYYSFADEGKMK